MLIIQNIFQIMYLINKLVCKTPDRAIILRHHFMNSRCCYTVVLLFDGFINKYNVFMDVKCFTIQYHVDQGYQT